MLLSSYFQHKKKRSRFEAAGLQNRIQLTKRFIDIYNNPEAI
jgi:hypothetical protein